MAGKIKKAAERKEQETVKATEAAKQTENKDGDLIDFTPESGAFRQLDNACVEVGGTPWYGGGDMGLPSSWGCQFNNPAARNCEKLKKKFPAKFQKIELESHDSETWPDHRKVYDCQFMPANYGYN